MPEAGFSYYTNAKHKRHSRWEDAIASDLRRDVEARFPAQKGREHTGIAGISMGGYGAVKLALKHPELYGFAARHERSTRYHTAPSQPAALGTDLEDMDDLRMKQSSRQDEDVFDLLDRTSDAQSVKWFESRGHNDPLQVVNSLFVRRMREHGVSLVPITTQGGHDWQSWNAAPPELFRAAQKSLR